MITASVSLILASRDRPDALMKLLGALRFQTYRNFETIIVSNCDIDLIAKAGIDKAAVKFEPMNTANLSAARNKGIAQAAGQIIAFCDDDAVPEPDWLAQMVTALDQTQAPIVGGFTLARNGFDLQFWGSYADQAGRDLPLEQDRLDQAPFVPAPKPGTFPRVHGTNFAIQADALRALGGFDENFAFFLDETELCRRAADRDMQIAFAPEAIVHHEFAPSVRRKADRTPRQLADIAKSMGYFCAKHVPKTDWSDIRAQFFAEQDRRITKAFNLGRLGGRDLGRLRAEIKEGFAVGLARAPEHQSPLDPALDPATDPLGRAFVPFATFPGAPIKVLGARTSQSDAIFKQAAALSQAGHEVRCILLDRSARYHHRRFHELGFWLQTGGQFGRSQRDDPLWKGWGFAARIKREEAAFLRHRSVTS